MLRHKQKEQPPPPPQDDAIIVAAKDGNAEEVFSLLGNKSVNTKFDGDREDTLLLAAASQGHLELVSALIAKGADVNQANKAGLTPLQSASQEGMHTSGTPAANIAPAHTQTIINSSLQCLQDTLRLFKNYWNKKESHSPSCLVSWDDLLCTSPPC